MGDFVAIAAFRKVPDPAAALDAAEALLRRMGLITGDPAPDSILGADGERAFRPGPSAAAATGYGDRLLSTLTNGVALVGPRYFHAYALGFSEWFACPACDGRIGQDDGAYGDQMGALGMAGGTWAQGRDEPGLVACPLCTAHSPVTDWGLDDPVFLADLAVEFWNWPALSKAGQPDGAWWNLDVTGALEQAVGAPVIITGYKV